MALLVFHAKPPIRSSTEPVYVIQVKVFLLVSKIQFATNVDHTILAFMEFIHRTAKLAMKESVP